MPDVPRDAAGARLPVRRLWPSQLGERLAASADCDIHVLDSGDVVKLYRAEVEAEHVHACARIDAIVAGTGLRVPAPRPYLVASGEGRLGAVFERIHGPSLLQRNFRRPWSLRRHARLLADQHRAIHARPAAHGLRVQRRVLEDRVVRGPGLTPAQRDALLLLLSRQPDGDRLCHGDFHWGNVLLAADGPTLIDWTDAATGNPLCDVARTWTLLRFNGLRSPPLTAYCRLAAASYLGHYLGDGDRGELARWQLLNAAARLDESIAGRERARLHAWLRPRLARLVAA